MEELFQQQYDAHVKTHQRYLLLKLLDGAKSEAMEQFLAQKTPLPKERVVVPHPETALPPLAFEAAVDPNDFRIFTPRDIPAPAAAAVPALTPDMALFEGIAPCTVQPSAVTLATEAVIDPEIFSGIPNGTAVLPQPAAAYEPDVPVMDAGELLPSVSIPNAAFSYQPTIDDAAVAVSIPALEAAPVALPKVAPDASAFQNVALPQVTLPTVAIPPVSVSPVLSDSDLPQVTLPHHAADAVYGRAAAYRAAGCRSLRGAAAYRACGCFRAQNLGRAHGLRRSRSLRCDSTADADAPDRRVAGAAANGGVHSVFFRFGNGAPRAAGSAAVGRDTHARRIACRAARPAFRAAHSADAHGVASLDARGAGRPRQRAGADDRSVIKEKTLDEE